jgi:hypothetical protein
MVFAQLGTAGDVCVAGLAGAGFPIANSAPQACFGGPNSHPHVPTDANRAETRIPPLIELVELQPGSGLVHRKVEGGSLDSLLLFAGMARQAGGESVGNAESQSVSGESG